LKKGREEDLGGAGNFWSGKRKREMTRSKKPNDLGPK